MVNDRPVVSVVRA